ncbi:hypothetical protein ACWGQ5_44990 [Streptomyces sp. NPDC055722]
MSSHNATQEGWFKRNADAMSRWYERLIFLGAYAFGIHRVYQHAFIHASLWFAVGVGGTLIHIADARRARRNAERARQQQLQKLAELFREVTKRKTDIQKN